MIIKIAGQIQEMAADEILDHVSASAYKRIKAQDSKAAFRAYCIGHEGETRQKLSEARKLYYMTHVVWNKGLGQCM